MGMKVYAMADEAGFIKIGIAGDSLSRMAGLQTGNPNRINIVNECECASERDAREIERHFHDCLRDCGFGASGEWFAPSIWMTMIVASMWPDDLSVTSQMAMDFACDMGASNAQYRTPEYLDGRARVRYGAAV